MSARRILVVEDNPTTRKLARVALEAEGYEVLEAPDASTALDLAASAAPDLILLDILLPDVTGLKLITQLRALPGCARIPIIAFTGFLTRLEDAGVAGEGFDDLVVKPVAPSRLIEVVGAHLAPASAPAGNRGAGRHLLVVNDDQTQLKLEALVFEQLGFIVETATDGARALEQARAHPPHVIVTDVLMPRLDGFDLCAAIRRDRDLSPVPVVMVTSFYLDQEDRELALRLGANDLVLQTPGLDRVITAVFTALEGPAPLAQAGALDDLRADHEARLIHQLEQQLRLRSGLAQQASVQTAALSVLASVSETLGRGTKLEVALGEVLAQCVDAAGWSRAAILLVDSHGNWRCPAQFDYGEAFAGELAVRLPRLQAVQTVLRDRLATTIASHDPASGPSADVLGLLRAQSALVVPIVSRDALIGLFIADSTIRSLSAEGWLPIAQGIASQIGQAIALAEAFEQISVSEKRYRGLVEHSTDAVMLIDHDLHIRYVSQSAQPLLGCAPGEGLEPSVLDLLHPDDRSLFQTELRGLTDMPERPARFELRTHPRNGSFRELEAIVTDRTDDPTLRAVVVNLRDVTIRKQAERALRESDARFRLLADHIQEVFFITDTVTMETLYVSPAFEKVFAMRIESAYAKPGAWLDAVHPEDRHRMEMTARSPATSGEVFRLLHPDGAVRWIRSRAFPARGPSGALDRLVGFVEDITELRDAEIRLQHGQKMEAVGRLAGGIAHDFNNLLTVILGFGQLGLQRLRADDPLRGYLEEMIKAGNRAGNLTRQLLAFSSQQAMTPRVVNVKQQLEELEKMLRRVLGEHIELSMAFAPDEMRIEVDPTQLDQVIVNLAVNARDAMQEGGGLAIDVRAEDSDVPFDSQRITVPPGSYVVVSVRDTGTGMDEATRRRIFEPFFTTKEQGKGTGLGLATVYGIIQQSGGFISVWSEPGRGTSFRIHLPRVEAPVQAPGAAAPSDVPRGNETILVVEDEEAVRDLARSTLDLAGYRVLAAANGGEALLLCERSQDPIHLVVSDVVMPGMGGPQLMQRLRVLRPSLRALYMSGYMDRDLSSSIQPGSAFLPKPFMPDELARKVRQVLDRTEEAAGGDPGSESDSTDLGRAAA